MDFGQDRVAFRVEDIFPVQVGVCKRCCEEWCHTDFGRNYVGGHTVGLEQNCDPSTLGD